MSSAFLLVSTCLYVLVGVTSLVMALKSLRAPEFLPFHAAAARQRWETIGGRLQAVVVALLRVSGLGFLIVGLQLIVVSVAINMRPDPAVTFVLPSLPLLFCVGLCVVNYQLCSRTGARTPWRGSLYAAVATAVALGLSLAR
jgi:hypothetical protein